jgi:hypothetical protein
VGEDARPDPEVTAPQDDVEQAQVACAWCGLFSPPGPACEVCGSPLPSAESSQATWTPAAIKYMEGEPTTHTFQVVDRPSEIAQPTPIPLVTPIVAQPDSGNAAALVEQAETLLKETKSLLLETASLLKERTDTTKTAEPDGNGASDHAVEDLMDAAAQLEERTEALRAEPELQDQPVEELLGEPIVEPAVFEPEPAEPEPTVVEAVETPTEPSIEEPPVEDERPKIAFDLGWTEPDLEPTIDLSEHERLDELDLVDEAPVVEEPEESKAPRRFRWRGRKRDEREELEAEEPSEPELADVEPMQAFIETVEPESVVAEPEVVEPEAFFVEPELVVPESEVVEPELVEPEAVFVEPELVEPEVVEPEAVEPEVVEPEPEIVEVVKPEVVETVEPEVVEAEVAVVEPEPEVVEPEPEIVEAEVEEAAPQEPPPPARRRRDGPSLQKAMEAAVERSFFVPAEQEEVAEEPEAPAEPPPVEEPKERGWPWRRPKKGQQADSIVGEEPESSPRPPEPELVQPAASVTDPVFSSLVPATEPTESIPSPTADLLAESAPPPQAAEATSAPPPVAQQRFVDWSEQPEGGAHPMAMPPPIEVITPLPVDGQQLSAVAPPATEPETPGSMAGKVPCSRCGQPSERGLCEACLDAIAELRQLSAQFGM